MGLELGPCQVLYGTAGSETDLGKTQGGVRVEFIEDVADLMSDQYGTQPEEQVVTGHSAQVIVPLADYTVENLGVALNRPATQSGTNFGVLGDSKVGTKKAADEGQSLLLKKYVAGAVSTDEDDWMRFPVAAATSSFEVAFDGSNQRIMEVTFRCFPDSSGYLYFLGDETAATSGT